VKFFVCLDTGFPLFDPDHSTVELSGTCVPPRSLFFVLQMFSPNQSFAGNPIIRAIPVDICTAFSMHKWTRFPLSKHGYDSKLLVFSPQGSFSTPHNKPLPPRCGVFAHSMSLLSGVVFLFV